DEWKWYSYRKFKAHLYMNVGPYIAYLFMRANIKPNVITVLYACMGILGGIFLATPSKMFILIGIILFYSRSILDWSDGLLARATNQTSITGAIIDPFGAHVGWVALWAGMGLYVANKPIEGIMYLTPNLIPSISILFENLIYLVPIIPAIIAMDIMVFAHAELFRSHLSKSTQKHLQEKVEKEDFRSTTAKYDLEKEHSSITKVIRTIHQLFEHNARTVDTICLIILLELMFPIYISWIVLLAFILWQTFIFAGTFYMVARGGWVEKEIQNKLE
ncbi:MAG: CDP-alcohol phosphatidyltransferase family protein, partial [Bacteroidales bacterium]|nr:CDP-alcohol phosphatidyltransferase family protein [Bacteroidales bacterium]